MSEPERKSAPANLDRHCLFALIHISTILQARPPYAEEVPPRTIDIPQDGANPTKVGPHAFMRTSVQHVGGDCAASTNTTATFVGFESCIERGRVFAPDGGAVCIESGR